MKIQQLLSPMRKAVNDYKMISNGDKIAVGVSGGKDSMALLHLLRSFQKFKDINFDLLAVTIDLGFTEDAFVPVQQYCKQNDINYICEKSDIGEVLFDIRKEQNPCSLCSKMRRGALNEVLKREGFSKLALGHHKNDVVETFLLSLFFEGRLSTFAPISYMDRAGVTLIRPLIYIDEYQTTELAKTLPVVSNPCPANKNTKREVMKDLLKNLSKNGFPHAIEKFSNAIMHPERYNLWDDVLEKYEKEKAPKDFDA